MPVGRGRPGRASGLGEREPGRGSPHCLNMGDEKRSRFVGDLAARYWARATEARTLARQMSRGDLRWKWLLFAEALEELARQAEQDATRRR